MTPLPEALLAAGQWDGAYCLMGHCVECALKACVAKQFRLHEVPDKKLVNSFYTHRLDELLTISDVKSEMEIHAQTDPSFKINWNTVRDAAIRGRHHGSIRSGNVLRRYERCIRDSAMDENTVVKEQLTDEMIEAGAQLTQKLDELGLPIVVAMWFFQSEINEWRLMFASPDLSDKGPQTVCRKIQEARKALGAQAERLPFSMIGLMDTHNEMIQELRIALRTGPGVSRVRFSKNVMNGHFIDDALIYRSAA